MTTDKRQLYIERLQRENLPSPDDQTMQYLHDIVDEGVLGASKHVQLIQALFLHIMQQTSNKEIAWRKIKVAGQLITETRGVDTPLIGNSIRWLLRDLDGHNPEQVLRTLRERTDSWQTEARQRLDKILQIGKAILGASPVILTFDYSSTVAAVVKAKHEHDATTTVIVPESRAIDGGKPYLQEFTQAGIEVSYILDTAIEYVMPTVTAVLLGVESLRCDGSFLNTIGSRTVARLAKHYMVPTYACTDLYKLDLRSYEGYLKTPNLRSYDERLLSNIALPVQAPRVTTHAPELEAIWPDLHAGFVTEHGLVPPQSIWMLGRSIFPEVAQ